LYLTKHHAFTKKLGTDCGECLLPFSSESFVFPSPLKNMNIIIYKTKILAMNLYGCETWSFTLKKEENI